jgi:hypothetical protein
MHSEKNGNSHEHLDPITGTPGAHPAGTGIGAASGGIAGAAAGVMAGPIGMAVGATVGVIAGGLAGKAAAESMSPTSAGVDDPSGTVAAVSVDLAAEDIYWRTQFRREPYYLQAYTYEDYAPAFLTGYLGYGRLAGSGYDTIESDLERDYSANRGSSALSWVEAKPATRAAWTRMERVLPPAPAAAA